MPADEPAPKPRVLHLLEPPRRSGGGRESSLFAWNLRRGAGGAEPGRVILLGDTMSERWARAHAISWDQRITPPAGRLPLAWSSLLASVRTRRPEVVHCWSLGSLRLASGLSRFHQAMIRGTLVEAPGQRERALRRARQRIERVETFDKDDAGAWRRFGVEASVVDLGRAEPTPGGDGDGAREGFRRAHGIESAALLLGTLFDHPRETDARRLSFLLAILAVSEHNTLGLAPEGARHVEAARRYARAINRDYRMLLSGRPLIEQLSVFDACVIPDPTRSQPRGARRVLEHAARCAGVRAFDRPEFAGVSGPTPPEMIRPMLDVLEGAA